VSQQRRHQRGHDLYMDRWHRKESLQRFLPVPVAAWMTQIDINCCEYCHLGGCLETVALIETKLIWSFDKTITVTENLGRRARLSGGIYLVEYQPTKPTHYCESCDRPDDVPGNDIEYFVVTGGTTTEQRTSVEKTPQEYAEWLWSLRFNHWLNECPNPAKTRMLHYPMRGGDDAPRGLPSALTASGPRPRSAAHSDLHILCVNCHPAPATTPATRDEVTCAPR